MTHTFYSHCGKDPETQKRAGTKLLRIHTFQVRDKALQQLHRQLGFSEDDATLRGLLEDICLLHDLGKYTQYFQNYLLQLKTVDPELKQHARLGAYAIYEKYKESPQLAAFAYFIVVSHHKNLLDIGEYVYKEDPVENRYHAIFQQQTASLQPVLAQIGTELNLPDIQRLLVKIDYKAYRKEVKKIQKKKQEHISFYFLVNYLFSLLIEADKLDASGTEVYVRRALPGDRVARYIAQFEPHALRTRVRDTVLGNLENKALLQRRIYTLTAPTGVGKTLTSLDFALRLRQLIREQEGHEAQIIYALPFINIIEQGLEVYQEVFGKEAEILAHYQFADVLGEDREAAAQGDDQERNYNQKLMELDTWQSDIVLTSFVQFFQTLIGNRNKLLKKFNHLAGSIVILDEVQTLRLEQLPLIGATLFYLSKYLHTRIILMTATRPKIFELAYEHILKKEDLSAEDKAFFKNLPQQELLTDFTHIFGQYKRTKIVPCVQEALAETEDFVSTYFSDAAFWTPQQSCLMVVNKVRRCTELYQGIAAYLTENNLTESNPVYCLSTNILPCQRLEIIEEVKEKLKKGIKVLLVATQCVEAGVDLDFDCGFRDLAPIDSMVQVAGRINRQCNPLAPERPHLPLYIIDFQDCKDIYGSATREVVKAAFEGRKEIVEGDYLELVNAYFDNKQASFETSGQIFESMKKLRYTVHDASEEKVVSQFAIITQRSVCSVFVEIDEKATEARRAFQALLDLRAPKEARQQQKQEFDKAYKRIFNQRIVSVPAYYLEGLPKIHDKVEDIYWVCQEDLERYYDRKTGFIRQSEPKVETRILNTEMI